MEILILESLDIFKAFLKKMQQKGILFLNHYKIEIFDEKIFYSFLSKIYVEKLLYKMKSFFSRNFICTIKFQIYFESCPIKKNGPDLRKNIHLIFKQTKNIFLPDKTRGKLGEIFNCAFTAFLNLIYLRNRKTKEVYE